MSKRLPITRQQLLDPEGSAIQALLDLARAVMYRHLRKNNLQAAKAILEHYEPKPSIQATIHGPVVLTWTDSSPSLTHPVLSNESSTMPGADNGREPQSSSVIDSLESL